MKASDFTEKRVQRIAKEAQEDEGYGLGKLKEMLGLEEEKEEGFPWGTTAGVGAGSAAAGAYGGHKLTKADLGRELHKFREMTDRQDKKILEYADMWQKEMRKNNNIWQALRQHDDELLNKIKHLF